jgi:hypothetical protein
MLPRRGVRLAADLDFKQPFLLSRAVCAEFCSRPLEKRAAGTPEEFRPPRPPALVDKKVQMNCRHREDRSSTGVPARAALAPFVPSNNFAQWVYGLIRMIPGGLTELSSAGGPPRLARERWHDTRLQAAKKGPVASGRLAGTRRLQPLRTKCVTLRFAATAPGPATSNTPRDAPLMGRDNYEYNPIAGNVKDLVKLSLIA